MVLELLKLSSDVNECEPLDGGGGGGGGRGEGEGEGGEWVAEEDFVEARGGWGAHGQLAAFHLGLTRECSDG